MQWSVEVPDSEVSDLEAEIARCRGMSTAAVIPKARNVKRRLRVLHERRQAAPGSSGWRNSYLAGFSEQQGGVAQLRLWTELWCRGRIAPAVADIWTSQVVSPKDCGPRAEDPQRRKLRPIALEEALVKFAESVAIDAAITDVLKKLEPMQLGAGTPDGTVLAVGVLRRWAQDAANEEAIAQSDADNEALEI